MKGFVQLTQQSVCIGLKKIRRPISIRVSSITAVYVDRGDGLTCIDTGNFSDYVVTETPEEVLEKIRAATEGN